jgi:hypothetical protein
MKFFKKQLHMLYAWYYRLRNLWPVWYYILNRTQRTQWQNYKKTRALCEKQQNLTDALLKDGIATLHIADFFEDKDIFNGLKNFTQLRMSDQEIQRKIADYEAGGYSYKDELMVHMLGGYGTSRYVLELDNPFLKFHLDRSLLEVVAAYMGFFPKFIMHSLHSMVLMPKNAKQKFSQNWHRDPDDKKIVKVFIYMTDVSDMDDGPFMYVKQSQLGGKWRSVFPQVPGGGCYVPDGMVESIIPEEDRQICLGKAGTIIFCDTSGLHKGGYCTNNRRIMSAATFVSNASIYRPNYKIGQADLSYLNDIARYAVF